MILAALLLLLAAGCRTEDGQQGESQQKKDTGVDKNYCAESSAYRMVEMEDGHFAAFFSMLYYAEKSDLTKWYLVCGDPTCDHTFEDGCMARLQPYSGVFIEDGRIYFVKNPVDFNRKLSEDSVYSMALDGSDVRLEYVIEGSLFDSGKVAFQITPDGVIVSSSVLQQDGMFRNSIRFCDASGSRTIAESTSEEAVYDVLGNGSDRLSINGDLRFVSQVVSSQEEVYSRLYRFTKDGVEEILNEERLPLRGACVLGDSAYQYGANSGFYQVDLTTGETEKVAENQLEDGHGYCVTDRYYFETNMYFMEETDDPTLMFYNGSQWHEVTMPEDIWRTSNAAFAPLTVSTEYIFIYVLDYDLVTYRLFRLDPTAEEYVLEPCGEFENLN